MVRLRSAEYQLIAKEAERKEALARREAVHARMMKASVCMHRYETAP